MKKLIYAIVAIMCGVCVAYAGESQEAHCGDKSLSYCIKHFDRQCNAKNYFACFLLGILYQEQKQYGESKKYFEMVCDKANSKDTFQVERIDGSLSNKLLAIEAMQASCSWLGEYCTDGKGTRQDLARAFHYKKKACDLGHKYECSSVGDAYYLGKGTKIDYKLAKSYYEKSCKMQDGFGYIGLGIMYQYGEGVPKNLSKAKELYGKSCDLGVQYGCDYYKELNEKGVK